MIQEFRVDRFKLLFDLQPEQFESDRNLLWYAQNRQLPEPEVVHVMLRALKAGDCAVDAGANVGFFTVLMSKLVGDRGRVLAIEPDADNLEKLHKNLDINSCANVEIVDEAIGRHAGYAPMYRHTDNGQISLFGNAAVGEELPMVITTTMDSILGKHRPVLIKLDIEGSEAAAVESLSYKCPCIISELNSSALQRAGSSARDLMMIMKHRGYGRYYLHPSGAPPSIITEDQVVIPTRENANILFATPGYVAKALWHEVVL
jgi:FkbM family methyltransferase